MKVVENMKRLIKRGGDKDKDSDSPQSVTRSATSPSTGQTSQRSPPSPSADRAAQFSGSVPLDPNELKKAEFKQEYYNKSKPSPIPTGPVVGKGAYLVYDVSSAGTLFLVWRETPCEEALAYFSPKRTVPDFKYKDKGGKNEIERNMMSNKKKYYDGWCQFFKMAADYNGDVMIMEKADEISPLKVEVYFLKNSIDVVKVVPGEWTTMRSVSAVSTIPKGAETFRVKTMKKELFISQGNLEGGVVTV